MTKKKTSEVQQGSQKILDHILTVKNVLEFADSLLAEWRPYFINDGEMLLGHELLINRAIIHQLQQAVASRTINYDLLIKTLSELVTEVDALKAENDNLKKTYADLCTARDKDQKVLSTITFKQKDFIEEVRNKFKMAHFLQPLAL